MRILYIDVNCKGSSTGKIVYDLYTQGRLDGNETAICYGRGAVVEGEHIFKFGLDLETKLHALLTRITGLTGCYSFFSTRRLLKFLDQFQPDVVHIHELHAYFVNPKPLLQYLAAHHIPVVHTFHCEFAYTGKCGHAYECDRWKSGCGHCPKLREYPKTLWFDFTAQMFRQKQVLLAGLDRMVITAPSQWLADRAKQSFLKNRDIRVVHNGIDTEQVFHPQEFQHLKAVHGLTEEKIVLAVAPDMMCQRKGGRWVLKLADKLKDENIKFILIGVADLTEQFPSNVIALGRTENQRELAEYYSMADCFVICSEKETFSMTCAESLCCETPVAGFQSGAPEVVFLPPTAVFVTYGNVDALADELRKMLNRQFSAEDWRILRARYAQKTMYEAYRSIYQELLTEGLV